MASCFPLFLAGELGVDLLPLRLDDLFQRFLGGHHGFTFGDEPLHGLPCRVEIFEQCQDPLLHRRALPFETLHLETHVLGLPGAHPAGVEPGLVLGQLVLQDLQLAFVLVEVEFEGLEHRRGIEQLLLQLDLLLVSLAIGLELGK